MSRHRSEFVRAVVERGFVHQATDLEGWTRVAAGDRLVGTSASTAPPTACTSATS